MMYEVTIGKFDSIEKRDRTHRYFIDANSFKDIIGIKYNGKIYDIENGISYQIIKKNEKGLLENNQDILINTDYALYIDEHKKYTIKEYLKAWSLKMKLKRHRRYMFDYSLESARREDYRAIKGDWEQVGKYIKKAMADYSENLSEEELRQVLKKIKKDNIKRW